MGASDLEQIVKHGRAERAAAAAEMRKHTSTTLGLCTCGRPLPCSTRSESEFYVRYWDTRLAVHEPKLAAMTAAALLTSPPPATELAGVVR